MWENIQCSERIQTKYEKTLTRKTPTTDTFHAVLLLFYHLSRLTLLDSLSLKEGKWSSMLSCNIALREKCPNTDSFLVHIFQHSDWIQENTGQKKLRIWILFTQRWQIKKQSECCSNKFSIRGGGDVILSYEFNKRRKMYYLCLFLTKSPLYCLLGFFICLFENDLNKSH